MPEKREVVRVEFFISRGKGQKSRFNAHTPKNPFGSPTLIEMFFDDPEVKSLTKKFRDGTHITWEKTSAQYKTVKEIDYRLIAPDDPGDDD